MSVTIECPCGHTVRLPDGMDQGRVKCTVCGELLAASDATPDPPEDDMFEDNSDHQDALDHNAETEEAVALDAAVQKETRSPASPSGRAKSAKPPKPKPVPKPVPKPHRTNMNHFEGRGGFHFAGLLTPSCFTRSSLTLLPERVRLKSTGFFITRRVDLRLCEIASGETRRSLAWYLLLPGILTLAQGVGVIFLFAFLFVRHSYIVLRCGGTNFTVRFTGGDDSDACAIVDAILQAASNDRQRSSGDSGSTTEPAQKP